MAKRVKDRMYYEITREKPFGHFQTLMVGGAAGSMAGFLIASLVGACSGLDMDTIVLAFLVASFLGFFFGGIFTWIALRYFGKWVSETSLPGAPGAPEIPAEASEQGLEAVEGIPGETAPVDEGDEAKGKSVDFVFPELSPDKQ